MLDHGRWTIDHKTKKVNTFNSEWRKVAAAIYKKPVDSKLFGSVEIDVTDLEIYISEKRKQGLKITLTHIFLLIVARALKFEVPQLNAYIKRGNVVEREHIDAMVSVLKEDSQMSQIKISDADTLTLSELTAIMNNEIINTKKGMENKTMKMKAVLASFPWPLRGWVFKFIRWITIDLGLSFPSIGLSANNFGAFVLTNIGSIGLDTGYPALFPTSNVAIVLVMGGVSKKPVVIDDQIVIRRILSLTAALDHRVVDAIHGGKLFKYIKQVVRNPKVLEEKP